MSASHMSVSSSAFSSHLRFVAEVETVAGLPSPEQEPRFGRATGKTDYSETKTKRLSFQCLSGPKIPWFISMTASSRAETRNTARKLDVNMAPDQSAAVACRSNYQVQVASSIRALFSAVSAPSLKLCSASVESPFALATPFWGCLLCPEHRKQASR